MSEILGYIATVLVILSYLSKDLKKLRVISIIACAIFIVYAVMQDLYPVLITNVSIIGVNIYRIIQESNKKLKQKGKDYV